jgi:hypothetical protein
MVNRKLLVLFAKYISSETVYKLYYHQGHKNFIFLIYQNKLNLTLLIRLWSILINKRFIFIYNIQLVLTKTTYVFFDVVNVEFSFLLLTFLILPIDILDEFSDILVLLIAIFLKPCC